MKLPPIVTVAGIGTGLGFGTGLVIDRNRASDGISRREAGVAVIGTLGGGLLGHTAVNALTTGAKSARLAPLGAALLASLTGATVLSNAITDK